MCGVCYRSHKQQYIQVVLTLDPCLHHFYTDHVHVSKAQKETHGKFLLLSKNTILHLSVQ